MLQQAMPAGDVDARLNELTKGRFEIPLGFISGSFDEDYDQLKWKLVERKIQQVILGKMDSKE